MNDAERPMRVATVRTLGVFLIVFAVSVLLTKAFSIARDWYVASRDAIFDFVVPREIGEAAAALAIAVAAFSAGRWLWRRPTAAARALMVVAVLAVGASLATGVKGLEPGAPMMTPRQREAFGYLRAASDFEMRYIGIGGSRSYGYLAMRILRRSAVADDAFKALLRTGTTAGQLYGLSGIYHTDPLAFAAALPRYRNSIETVGVFSGCILSPERVSEIVCSGNHKSDICGGAIPAEFKEADFDEADALADERLADFRNDH